MAGVRCEGDRENARSASWDVAGCNWYFHLRHFARSSGAGNRKVSETALIDAFMKRNGAKPEEERVIQGL